MSGEKKYTDEFLKLRNSLFTILARFSAAGYDLNNRSVQEFIFEILDRECKYTDEKNAWDQYEHLASWLVEFGSVVDLSTSNFKQKYLDLVNVSFRYVSKQQYLGYAWKAFEVWNSQWDRLLVPNRAIIKEMINESRFSSINGVKYLLDHK